MPLFIFSYPYRLINFASCFHPLFPAQNAWIPTVSRSSLITCWVISILLRLSVANPHTLYDLVPSFRFDHNLPSCCLVFSFRRLHFHSPLLDLLSVSGLILVCLLWITTSPSLSFQGDDFSLLLLTFVYPRATCSVRYSIG